MKGGWVTGVNIIRTTLMHHKLWMREADIMALATRMEMCPSKEDAIDCADVGIEQMSKPIWQRRRPRT